MKSFFSSSSITVYVGPKCIYICCLYNFCTKSQTQISCRYFGAKQNAMLPTSFVCHAILFEKPTQFSCCYATSASSGSIYCDFSQQHNHSAVQLCTIVHRISVYLSLYLSYLFALTQIVVVVVVVQKVKALDFQKYFIMLFCYTYYIFLVCIYNLLFVTKDN